MQVCPICVSPYREELMRAWHSGFPRKQLYQKYVKKVWKKQITFISFQSACYKHLKHNPPNIVVVEKKDTQGIAKMMTELYARKIEGMKPEDVTTKDYVSVNKLVIDEQKLSLDKNAQMLEFAKIFGIPESPLTVIEGVEDAQLGPPEDQGNQPENT